MPRMLAGQRPSDRNTGKVIQLSEGGLSNRLIGRQVGLSKNTVGDIVSGLHLGQARLKVSRKVLMVAP